MSTNTVVELSAKPLTIKLRNGQTVSFKSNVSIEVDEIPVIDIQDIFSDDLQARKAVAEKVREACHRIGFFYALNHVSLPYKRRKKVRHEFC